MLWVTNYLQNSAGGKLGMSCVGCKYHKGDRVRKLETNVIGRVTVGKNPYRKQKQIVIEVARSSRTDRCTLSIYQQIFTAHYTTLALVD